MYDDVFREQLELGVIEKIDNLEQFLQEHPECSFLPHMGVFKMSSESTKCRVVFLSNMHEKGNQNISHNMAMLPGPNLNYKISAGMLMNRLEENLVTFDLKKAFLQIKLNESDMNRLCFLWYRNVEKGDYTLVGYRNVRLSFGLRPSPTILMLALYHILVQKEDPDRDTQKLKNLIYNNMYMDNGSFGTGDIDSIVPKCEKIIKIFGDHKFELQQFATNVQNVQDTLDNFQGISTPNNVKLLGMNWSRDKDTLSPYKIALNTEAKSKRQILATLHSVYDIFNFYGPILLRAKIFMQKLQEDHSLKWDTTLPDNTLKEWRNIAKQANTSRM